MEFRTVVKMSTRLLSYICHVCLRFFLLRLSLLILKFGSASFASLVDRMLDVPNLGSVGARAIQRHFLLGSRYGQCL